MSTSLNSVLDSLSSRSKLPKKARSKNPTSSEGIDSSIREKAQTLIADLQKSLDPKEVIELFSNAIRSLVPHDGVQYSNEVLGEAIHLGVTTLHTCHYRLVESEHNLGEISFTRSYQFNEPETLRLEYLLCSLFYPLRNALLYHQALLSAFRDPLTGLQNRASMDSALQRETRLACRHNTPLSLLVMDVDRFKSINDTYGHSAGDAILKELTGCALQCIRSTDMLFRYGGEEFVILMSNTSLEGAELMAQRIRKSVEKQRFKYTDTIISASVSIGIAEFLCDDDKNTLFDRADRALYSAKQQGRNRVVIAS